MTHADAFVAGMGLMALLMLTINVIGWIVLVRKWRS